MFIVFCGLVDEVLLTTYLGYVGEVIHFHKHFPNASVVELRYIQELTQNVYCHQCIVFVFLLAFMISLTLAFI